MAVNMGSFYHVKGELVKTVCRAIDTRSNEPMIAFVKILDGGFASEVFLLLETEFNHIFTPV